MGLVNGQVKMQQSLTISTEIQPFSLNKYFWIVASLWLISIVLKKLILIIFASVLIAFLEEQFFRGSYSAIPTEVLSLLVFVLQIFLPIYHLSIGFAHGGVHWTAILNFDVIKFTKFLSVACALGV